MVPRVSRELTVVIFDWHGLLRGAIGSDQCLKAAVRGWGGHGGLSSAKESFDCGKDAALMDSLTALIACVCLCCSVLLRRSNSWNEVSGADAEMSCMEVLSMALLTLAGFFSRLVIREAWPDFLRFYQDQGLARRSRTDAARFVFAFFVTPATPDMVA